MKQSDIIELKMFAPCGMNCEVCYKHLKTKNGCLGCLNGDAGKPEHCRICRIKTCAHSKALMYCYACVDFPCKLIKNLEKSYVKRYHVSLVENSLTVKCEGLEAFMKNEKGRWTCKSCGGVISLHDALCSECQLKGVNIEISNKKRRNGFNQRSKRV